MSLDGTLTATAESEQVAFTFTVTNAGDEAVDLQFSSGKVADVAVHDGQREVWRWSDGRMFTQALETEHLSPGESLSHEVAWENPPAGEYTAEATLAATNTVLNARTAFEVA